MKTDRELRRDVEAELAWEPSIDAVEALNRLHRDQVGDAPDTEKAAWAAPGVRSVKNYITVNAVA